MQFLKGFCGIMEKIIRLWQLFLTFLKIGLCGIGGGYAIIPLINEQIVMHQHWLSAKEFSDMITISQITPGPLTVNISTFVGMRLEGALGAVCATVGCILCGVFLSFVIYSLFQSFTHSPYFTQLLKGLKACSLGLIGSACVLIIKLAFFGSLESNTGSLDHFAVLIFIITAFVAKRYQFHPLIIMGLAGVLGVIFF